MPVLRLAQLREGDRRLAGDEVVVLKGSRDGVSVIINEQASIEAAVRDLRAKLANAGSFFRGAVFRLESGNRTLSSDEREALTSTMEEFGILLRDSKRIERSSGPHVRGEHALSRAGERVYDEPVEAAARDTAEEATLLVRRTLRSGQRIEYDGNVVIVGDVNAGAVVTCSGDIIVLGALRGLAHAGAEGNTDAIVMAFRLQPTQLRIAHYISRPPDDQQPSPSGPEVALVQDERIQIEAYVP